MKKEDKTNWLSLAFKLIGLGIFINGIIIRDWILLVGGFLIAEDLTEIRIIHFHDGEDK